MSDPREALVQAMLSYDANGLTEVPSARGWAEHVAAAVLREFLVVPRSDIMGMEYGWRLDADDGVQPNSAPMWALADAELNGGEAVERPVLQWTPIRPGEALDAF